jgi:phospholipase/carboxylesterase
MRAERLAGLTVRVTGGQDGKGAGNGASIVLLHGFGAPGNDLVSLAEAIPVPPGTRFFFPAAPLSLQMGFGDSRAWWMLDLERRNREIAAGLARDLSRDVPVGLAEARAKILSLLDELERRYKIDPRRTVLGGFSQGAMLACDVALRMDRPLAGLVLLSSTLLARDEWVPLMPKRCGMKVFMSHGSRDQLLPALLAEQLRDLLTQAGLLVEWVGFHGVHEISDLVLTRLAAFLQLVLVQSQGRK